jgi:serine/threonine protein kinase
LEHLQELKILYRDVKPENLMLNEIGRMKLVDFGFAKILDTKTYTICGTPDFMAPEMMKMCGYDHAVDWWALGIVLYDLMIGHTPFEAHSPVATFQKVAKGLPKEPQDLCHDKTKGSKRCSNLIRQLCAVTPKDRLPMREGVTGIQQHEWFAFSHFEWESLKDGSMIPPLVPILSGPKDISNFAQHQYDKAPEAEYHDDFSQWDAEFAAQVEKTGNFTASRSNQASAASSLSSAGTHPDIDTRFF